MLKISVLKIDRCTVSKYAPVAQISYCVMSQTVEFTGDAGIAIRKCLRWRTTLRRLFKSVRSDESAVEALM